MSLEIEKIFHQRFLYEFLTKFDENFFILLLQIYKIQIKNFIKFDQELIEIFLMKDSFISKKYIIKKLYQMKKKLLWNKYLNK